MIPLRVTKPVNAGWCVVAEPPSTPYDDVYTSSVTGLVVKEFGSGWPGFLRAFLACALGRALRRDYV